MKCRSLSDPCGNLWKKIKFHITVWPMRALMHRRCKDFGMTGPLPRKRWGSCAALWIVSLATWSNTFQIRILLNDGRNWTVRAYICKERFGKQGFCIYKSEMLVGAVSQTLWTVIENHRLCAATREKKNKAPGWTRACSGRGPCYYFILFHQWNSSESVHLTGSKHFLHLCRYGQSQANLHSRRPAQLLVVPTRCKTVLNSTLWFTSWQNTYSDRINFVFKSTPPVL